MKEGVVEPVKIIEQVLIDASVEDADHVADEIAARLSACLNAFGWQNTFIGLRGDIERLTWLRQKEPDE